LLGGKGRDGPATAPQEGGGQIVPAVCDAGRSGLYQKTGGIAAQV